MGSKWDLNEVFDLLSTSLNETCHMQCIRLCEKKRVKCTACGAPF